MKIRTLTRRFGLLGVGPAVAAILALGHAPIAAAGPAVPSAATEIWTCTTSADEAGTDDGTACEDIPEKGGTLLQRDEATTALGGADTAFVGVKLLPQADWRQDEDGAPVPTFDAIWVRVTD